MNDLLVIAETLRPVVAALWDATLIGLSSSKAAYAAGGVGLGLFLTWDWRKLTAGDFFKAALACIGLFVLVALASSMLTRG